MNTKLTVLTLSMFALKFSKDARQIKDQISIGLNEQKNINQQWISLFKKLPIGIVIASGRSVLHTNRKMREITGLSKIQVRSNYPISNLIQMQLFLSYLSENWEFFLLNQR